MAILMAIGLKYFLVEAFQIPTPSMQPVLMGSPSTGIHDRILVNKASYLLKAPERWQVAVFRYPHNQSQNYVKRIVGLPDEKLRIFNGDIYRLNADPAPGQARRNAPGWEAVRKPAGLMKSLWKSMWAQEDEDNASIARIFNVRASIGGKWKVGSDGALRVDASGKDPTRAPFLNSNPENRYTDGYPRDLHAKLAEEAQGGENLVVADLQWCTELEVLPNTRAVEMRAYETYGKKTRAWCLRLAKGEGGRANAVLSYYANGSDLRQGKPATIVVAKGPPIDFSVGNRIDLELSNWDDQCFASVDGTDFGPSPYKSPLEPTQGISLDLLVDGSAVFRGTTLARDNTYERWREDDGTWSDDVVEVPSDHYWMLGDNQRNSDDGRTWRRMTIWAKDGKLVAPGQGTPIVGNARFEYENRPGQLGVDENPVVVPGVEPPRVVFTDRYGEEHVLYGSPEDLLSSARGWRKEDQDEHARFVPARFFIGRAFATFFPFQRIGLIR